MANYYLVRYSQEGSQAERDAKRSEHIAYRKGLGAVLILAGPLVSETGEPVGSVVIYAAADGAEAERLARGDPFAVAGLLKLNSIEQMRISAFAPPAI